MSSASDSHATQIRLVAPDDFDVWEPLWLGYESFYAIDIPPLTTKTTWARFHDPAEPLRAGIAWRAGKAVGLVHWLFHRSTWKTTDYCYLQDLFVAPDQRGGGIGRTLIEHVCADAARAGSPHVYWLTHETNSQAMALYDAVAQKTGFVHYRKVL